MATYNAFNIGLFAVSFLLLIIGGLLWNSANKKAEGESKQPSLGIGIAMVIYGILALFVSVLSFFVKSINVGPLGVGLLTVSLILQLIGGLLWNNANKKPEGDSKQPSLGIGVSMVLIGTFLLFGSIGSLFLTKKEAQSVFYSPPSSYGTYY